MQPFPAASFMRIFNRVFSVSNINVRHPKFVINFSFIKTYIRTYYWTLFLIILLLGRVGIYDQVIILTIFYFRKHFVDWRLRQWQHQNHRFRTVQDYGLWQLQSWSWHGPDVTGCRNLLVFASRMFRGWQNPTQNLVKSRCVVTRCHFLPMPLWQKGKVKKI